MTDLSPQAQAVLDAYWKSPWDPCLQHEDRCAIAAAIRAAADQVVPEEPEPEQSTMLFSDWNLKIESWDAHMAIRRRFLAIAAELEGKGNG